MGRSQETFNKKDVRTKKEKKRKEKLARKLSRKEEEKKGNLEDMIMYLDENGNFTEIPPDPTKKKKEIDSESIAISIPKMDHVEVDPIRKGIVSFFNDAKGFGFIKDSETQESVFVHINNVIDEIKENNVVNFEVEMGMKGPTATNVKIFKEPIKPSKPAPVADASTEAVETTSKAEADTEAKEDDQKTDSVKDKEDKE